MLNHLTKSVETGSGSGGIMKQTAREFLNRLPIPSELEMEDCLEAFARDRDAEIIREIDNALSAYPNPRAGTISWGIVRSLEHIKKFIVDDE